MLADANFEAPAVGKPRLKSGERRAAIIRTAVETFAQRGFRGTTTRELASAVGVSEPVLYQHFATKRELYTAIVDHMVAEASQTFDLSVRKVNGEQDDVGLLQALGEMILGWYLDDPAQIRLLLFSGLEGHELAELWHERATTQFKAFIASYMERRIRQGAFRGFDPQTLAFAFVGPIAHYGLVSTVFRCPLPERPKADVVREFVDLFLNGIRPRAEGEQ
ncbi:TetR/AcrR family transcriptional regulator [uncultured Paludibaculum sp.]|uniref:TetR/AcrR family transcriptional regulator n=1 Tax=uncultured Paludibaculum sp. TaxID=1765020 RepID=UPI002AAB5261|nr:TetR/AcrR family transcriptional regulator [uncultured Paludibaculum sp.]